MEPIITGTTILALIAQFQAGRSAKDQKDFNQFSSWMIENNHHEKMKKLEQIQGSVIAIKAYLYEQNTKNAKKLDQLIEQNLKNIQTATQIHSGSGDNVGGNKTTHIYHSEKKN